MPIDKNRFAKDIQLTEKKYEAENVYWAADLSWVRINNFRLPDNFRHSKTNILILVPANYGSGGRFRDIFIDPDLELLAKDGKTYERLGKHLHYFEKYPYQSMKEDMKTQFENNNWGYLCLHDQNPESSIVNFLFKVSLFLGNIHKDWKTIYEKYRKQ